MKKPAPFGKYFLLERINVGGMAEVFRAKAFGVEGFERLVAVKRILPNIAEDKEFIRMFIDEAKLAVQLNHANIAQIFDLGVVDGSYYIALEHVHGRDLRNIFDRGRGLGEAMPVAQACFVVMKVCEGLDYAHNKRDQSGRELNLVHRDVSPQNVLVSFEGEVKLIDFGIAKAAGKGSKTQAGILKGKFGYMSPEQVRGMPIDRRSDVFSCGIVLYELLTGERLFVGESDFSTLEKVRNVEILPPSTYNRKIPDELERIVLKALAKDVEDRYQNAIDLHDELQAFVYTAGEFYSRKDLAGWMKKTFGKEIEEETAKLESYRQLKPPASSLGEAAPPRPTGSRPPVNAPPSARKTQSAQALTKPPPPPSLGKPSSQNIQTKPVRKGRGEGDDLSWDDDELETQIYDDAPEADGKKRPNTPPRAAVAVAAVEAVASAPSPTTPPPLPPPHIGPDLSSLVSTGRGWEPARANALPPPPPPPVGGANGTPPHLASGRVASPLHNPLAATALAVETDPNLLPVSAALVPTLPPPPRETSISGRLVAMPTAQAVDPMFEPMQPFGSGMMAARQSSKRGLLFALIGGAVAIAIAVTLVVTLSGKKDTTTASTTDKPTPDVAPPPAVGDQNTGFDLYVSPAGISQWKLDGETRTDRLPSRIRGIAPGVHEVAIEAPAGFMSQSQHVTVEAGKSSKVEIELDALDITGEFESTPPGATVSLIVDGKRQEVGPSPAKIKLDPHQTYQVLFEKTGYVSVNRPINFTGTPSEKVVVNLEKAGPAVAEQTPPTAPTGPTGPVTKPVDNTPKPPVVVNNTPKPPVDKPPVVVNNTPKPPPVDKPLVDNTPKPPVDNTPKPPVDKPASGTGTLALGSKPPCDIYIDGAATGGHTPSRTQLPVGKHKVTLVNSEFNIRETFSVDIKADAVDLERKDYSDRLPK